MLAKTITLLLENTFLTYKDGVSYASFSELNFSFANITRSFTYNSTKQGIIYMMARLAPL
jgi:hypothetical protein